MTHDELSAAGRKGGLKRAAQLTSEGYQALARKGGKAAQASGAGHRWQANEVKAHGADGGKRRGLLVRERKVCMKKLEAAAALVYVDPRRAWLAADEAIANYIAIECPDLAQAWAFIRRDCSA